MRFIFVIALLCSSISHGQGQVGEIPPRCRADLDSRIAAYNSIYNEMKNQWVASGAPAIQLDEYIIFYFTSGKKIDFPGKNQSLIYKRVDPKLIERFTYAIGYYFALAAPACRKEAAEVYKSNLLGSTGQIITLEQAMQTTAVRNVPGLAYDLFYDKAGIRWDLYKEPPRAPSKQPTKKSTRRAKSSK